MSQAATRQPLITPSLHHVNLKTTRLQAMIDWYAQTLGMQVIHQFPGGAWISNDAANHRIALLGMPGFADDPEKHLHTGLHHTAFEYASFAELMESYARLRDAGITPQVCLDHGMTTSLYYADPDKNFLELQADNFGDWAQSKEWMRSSPQFAANPIGVFFDPARVLDAYRAGTPAAELHRAVMAGGYLPDTVPDLGLPPPA